MFHKTFLSVQFLRFVAALLVVLSHANYVAGVYWPNANSPAVNYLFNFGHSGVHIFFVISGFVMVYSTFNVTPAMSPRDFLLRRFLRIYPIYWIYAVAYFAWKVSESGAIPVADIVRSLFLLPGYSELLIGQGWTLSYEVYFYLCFAAAMTLGMNRGLIAVSMFFVASIALRGFVPIDDPNVGLISNSLLLEFIAGSSIAAAMLNGFQIRMFACRVAIGTALLAFGAGIWFGYDRIPTVICWGAPSTLLVGGLAFAELKGQIPDRMRRLAYLGDSSYSLYLLHTILLGGMFCGASYIFSGNQFERLILCAVFSAACCLISIVCFNAIETRIALIRPRQSREWRGRAMRHLRP